LSFAWTGRSNVLPVDAQQDQQQASRMVCRPCTIHSSWFSNQNTL